MIPKSKIKEKEEKKKKTERENKEDVPPLLPRTLPT